MRQVGLIYDAELAPVGLKTSQYSLLSCVLKFGPLQPRDLAKRMKMEPSTLSRNLKPLVGMGYVQVQAGNDGRSRMVSITESGRDLRERARKHWQRAQYSLNHKLGLSRVVELHTLIQESLALLGAQDQNTGNE